MGKVYICKVWNEIQNSRFLQERNWVFWAIVWRLRLQDSILGLGQLIAWDLTAPSKYISDFHIVHPKLLINKLRTVPKGRVTSTIVTGNSELLSEKTDQHQYREDETRNPTVDLCEFCYTARLSLLPFSMRTA